MYKNIQVLKKSEFKNINFNQIDAKEFVENIKIIPLGVDEVYDYVSYAPIIITGGEDNEFALFPGITDNSSVFHKCDNINTPFYINSYPFLMLKVKDENDEIVNLIGIDNNEKFVGEGKTNKIFKKDEELDDLSENIINNLKIFHQKREVSKNIMYNLKEKDLLQKQSFKIKVNEKEKDILTDYYIVDRKKLLELDDETLSIWAKKGWISLIDAHLNSLKNFKKLVNNL